MTWLSSGYEGAIQKEAKDPQLCVASVSTDVREERPVKGAECGPSNIDGSKSGLLDPLMQLSG